MLVSRPMIPSTDQGQLASLRLVSQRAILRIIWLHGPVLLLAGWLTGTGLLLALSLWICVTAAATMAHRRQPGASGTRATVAAALCAMPALLVTELAGHSWQIDAHMYFFAALAITAPLLDRRAVMVGAGVIALHHLALNFALPALVFPGGGDVFRVLFHAVILVFEAAALAWLVDRTARSISAAEASAVEVAQLAKARKTADLESQARTTADRRSATLAMATELDSELGDIAAGLATSSMELNASADALSASAVRTSRQAAVSTESTQHASASVQTVVIATDEMNATISEITRRVSEAAAATSQALEEAQATDATVRELAEGASRIGDVVRLIGNIAAQTNLLALNATIEAARAGEHGKGFAVVASEVKTLATETAKATKEISIQIAQIQDVTVRAVEAIHGIGATMERMSGIATAIAAAVEEQGAATREIASAAQQAASGTEVVAAAVAEVNASVAETSASATTMRGLSGEVARQGERLLADVTALSGRLRREAEAA